MPVLAAYIGYSGVSTALETQDGTFSFQRFPYAYSYELFSSVCDDKFFYKQVLENVAKENKVKIEECDILLTGFINFPIPEGLNVKLTMDVKDVISKHEADYPVMVDESLILTKEKVLSHVPVDYINNNEYYANLSIYPQLITRDYEQQVSLDGLIIDKVKKAGINLTSDKPIVFTGDRFARKDYEPVFKYALALDLFSSPGCYYVKIDRNNAVILAQLIKEYNQSFGDIDTSGVIEDVGTYILSPGITEVLVSTTSDTGQFFDIKKDFVFIVPVDNSLVTKMNLKNKCIGNIDGVVSGGKLGLLFDTREERSQLISDIKIMNSFMREIEEVVRGI